MDRVDESRLTPIQIAGIYALCGSIWIVITDQLVEWLLPSVATMTYAQTVKGLLFVAGSAVLIYLLTRRSTRQLERTNRRLDLTLRHSSVLHRILRHNLRNSCNVIQGTADTLRTEESSDNSDALDRIDDEAAQLVSLSEKSRSLESVIGPERQRHVEHDLTVLLESRVEQYRERFPTATIEVNATPDVQLSAHPKFELAVDELLENALVHTDRGEPTVTCTLEVENGRITLEITDDGSGMPPIEQQAINTAAEDQLVHSDGLGLWLTKLLVLESGGRFEIASDGTRGTTIRTVF
ncbi:HAMP domain-containing histidine kinase [Halobacteria archaeon AArc-curdl1]|uniref:histidine kinase n=1 Tax=Natronosalvus hydrolyticus TaxID=2979988 RepID=A0AAP3E4Y3_9EURY|nr:HAMP domain-containing histidine kinase [Halobacteria archaeon AArc-curdl1]